jgi:hypothetical protein
VPFHLLPFSNGLSISEDLDKWIGETIEVRDRDREVGRKRKEKGERRNGGAFVGAGLQ